VPLDLAMVIETDDPDKVSAAIELARRLGLDGPPSGGGLHLAMTGEGLELRRPGDRPGTGVRADLERLARPMSMKGRARQPIVRAIGPLGTRVVDATAGLGGDTALLVRLGYRLEAIERHPVAAALLADGLARARALGRLDRDVPVHAGDARTILQTLVPPPAVVYLDPMFPPKRKDSPLPPKPVQVLRALVGDDDDAAELLGIARRCVTDRVVVKRPLHAPPLAPDVARGHAGKLVRYDVYRPSDPGAGP